VSRHDAVDGEMGFPRRLSREQQERLLAGAPFADGGELDRTAAFARALPALVREQPDEVLTAALMPRLAAAARSSAVEAAQAPTVARRRVRSRRMLVARVAVAVALLPALMAGLAFAGVTLPEPARDAFDRVGVDLPNQSAVDEDAAAGDDDAVQPGSETSEQKRKQGTEKSNPARAQGRGHGAQGRGRALGKRGVAPGQTGSVGNAGTNNAGGQGKSQGAAQSQGKASGSARRSPPPQAREPVTPPGRARGKKK
jgi:hypothetical protein